MCNFLSALVLQNGDLICEPEYTDSHEELIASRGLGKWNTNDPDRATYVRVEFRHEIGGRLQDVDSYELTLDEHYTPIWWTDELRLQVADRLRAVVSRMIVTDERDLLLGGCWIVSGGAHVATAKNCRIVCVSVSARIGDVCDSARIGDVFGSARIGDVYDSARIGDVFGSARIDRVYGSARIDRVYGSARIDRVCGSARIDRVCGSARIDRVFGSARIVRDNRKAAE